VPPHYIGDGDHVPVEKFGKKPRSRKNRIFAGKAVNVWGPDPSEGLDRVPSGPRGPTTWRPDRRDWWTTVPKREVPYGSSGRFCGTQRVPRPKIGPGRPDSGPLKGLPIANRAPPEPGNGATPPFGTRATRSRGEFPKKIRPYSGGGPKRPSPKPRGGKPVNV
jgi:hypothetical protein